MPDPKRIQLADDRPPWHQQPGQPALAHGYLMEWLALPKHRRSSSKAAEHLGIGQDQILKYMSRHHWLEIADAWDLHVQARWFDQMANHRIARMGQLDAELDGSLALAAKYRRWLADDPDVDRVPRGLEEVQDYTRLVSTATTTFKTIYGAAPETVEHTGPGGGAVQLDFSELDNLTPEELAERLALLTRKPEPPSDL